MLTRCPYPDCFRQFDLDVPDELIDAQRPFVGECMQCGRPASFRDWNLIVKIEQSSARRLAQGQDNRGQLKIESAPRLSALVEDVRSLFNVGSIFRTSDGAGITALFLCGISGCPPHKRMEKTSLGAEQTVPWQYAPHAMEVINRLKAEGVTMVGLERTDGSQSLADVIRGSLTAPPICLLVGNEVSGLSAEALASCDIVCHLPMRGTKESLNVSVAFGIAAYMLADAFSNG